MSSSDISDTTLSIAVVVEGSKVHEYWVTLGIESSSHNFSLSIVGELVKWVVSCNIHGTSIDGVHNGGSLTTGMIMEVGCRFSTSVDVLDQMGTSNVHLGILLNIVELSKVLKILFIKFKVSIKLLETNNITLSIELSGHDDSLSIVGIIVEFVVSLDLHLSSIDGVTNSWELTISHIVELGLRPESSVEIVYKMSSSESHLGVLWNVVELSKVEKHWDRKSVV